MANRVPNDGLHHLHVMLQKALYRKLALSVYQSSQVLHSNAIIRLILIITPFHQALHANTVSFTQPWWCDSCFLLSQACCFEGFSVLCEETLEAGFASIHPNGVLAASFTRVSTCMDMRLLCTAFFWLIRPMLTFVNPFQLTISIKQDSTTLLSLINTKSWLGKATHPPLCDIEQSFWTISSHDWGL